MSRLIILDSGPLGLVTNPSEADDARRCHAWLRGMLVGGARVAVPEIADYEIRRELIRAGRPKGIARLDALAEQVGYLPITTPVMRLAAELWARVRNAGKLTAKDAALDADVILAAMAWLAAQDGLEVVVATDNIRHLELFVTASLWEEITLGRRSDLTIKYANAA